MKRVSLQQYDTQVKLFFLPTQLKCGTTSTVLKSYSTSSSTSSRSFAHHHRFSYTYLSPSSCKSTYKYSYKHECSCNWISKDIQCAWFSQHAAIATFQASTSIDLSSTTVTTPLVSEYISKKTSVSPPHGNERISLEYPLPSPDLFKLDASPILEAPVPFVDLERPLPFPMPKSAPKFVKDIPNRFVAMNSIQIFRHCMENTNLGVITEQKPRRFIPKKTVAETWNSLSKHDKLVFQQFFKEQKRELCAMRSEYFKTLKSFELLLLFWLDVDFIQPVRLTKVQLEKMYETEEPFLLCMAQEMLGFEESKELASLFNVQKILSEIDAQLLILQKCKSTEVTTGFLARSPSTNAFKEIKSLVKSLGWEIPHDIELVSRHIVETETIYLPYILPLLSKWQQWVDQTRNDLLEVRRIIIPPSNMAKLGIRYRPMELFSRFKKIRIVKEIPIINTYPTEIDTIISTMERSQSKRNSKILIKKDHPDDNPFYVHLKPSTLMLASKHSDAPKICIPMTSLWCSLRSMTPRSLLATVLPTCSLRYRYENFRYLYWFREIQRRKITMGSSENHLELAHGLDHKEQNRRLSRDMNFRKLDEQLYKRAFEEQSKRKELEVKILTDRVHLWRSCMQHQQLSHLHLKHVLELLQMCLPSLSISLIPDLPNPEAYYEILSTNLENHTTPEMLLDHLSYKFISNRPRATMEIYKAHDSFYKYRIILKYVSSERVRHLLQKMFEVFKELNLVQLADPHILTIEGSRVSTSVGPALDKDLLEWIQADLGDLTLEAHCSDYTPIVNQKNEHRLGNYAWRNESSPLRFSLFNIIKNC